MGSKAGTIFKGKLAEYELIEVLKAGSLSTVWKARNLSTDTLVAVKVFNSMTSASAERTKKKLVLEGFTTKLLEHPSICRVQDFFFMPDHTNGLVMEYLDGIDLADFISRRNHKPVPVRTALKIVRTVSEALDYSHNLKLHKKSLDSKYDKILHLDIKPANIFLTSTGEVKLIDFGISRIDSDEIEIQHMGHGFTRTYSAPELWDADEKFLAEKYNESHDLYSLGLVFFELVTGREAFSNIYQARIGRIKCLSQFGQIKEVVNLFKRWTGADLSERFGSARDLIAALDEVLKVVSTDEMDVSREVESASEFLFTGSSSTVFNTIVTSHIGGIQQENLVAFLKLCLLTHLTPLAGKHFDGKPLFKSVMLLCIEKNIKTKPISQVDDVHFYALFEIFRSFDAGTSLAFKDFKTLIMERVQFLDFLRLSLGQDKCYEFYQITKNFLTSEKVSSEVLAATLLEFRTRLMLDPFRCMSEDYPDESLAQLAYMTFLGSEVDSKERDAFVRREVKSKCAWIDNAYDELKERLPSERQENVPDIPKDIKQMTYSLAAKFISKILSKDDQECLVLMRTLFGDKKLDFGDFKSKNIPEILDSIPKGEHAFVISRVLCFVLNKKGMNIQEQEAFSQFADHIEKKCYFEGMTETQCFFMMEPVLAFRHNLPIHRMIASRIRSWLPFTDEEIVKSFFRFHQISYLFDDPMVPMKELKTAMENFNGRPLGHGLKSDPQFFVEFYINTDPLYTEPMHLLMQFELLLLGKVQHKEAVRFVYAYLELELRFNLESGSSADHHLYLEESAYLQLCKVIDKRQISESALPEAINLINIHYNTTIVLPKMKRAKAA